MRDGKADAAVAGVFVLLRLAAWFDQQVAKNLSRWAGYVFATGYALIATYAVLGWLSATPVPRFADIFLIGIVLTTYLYGWQPAVWLFLYSVGVTLWVLPPYGSLLISRMEDLYRVNSYSISCLFVIFVIQRVRAAHHGVTSGARHESARTHGNGTAPMIGLGDMQMRVRQGSGASLMS
jgi:K+-sensing histidine kinase KdpD